MNDEIRSTHARMNVVNPDPSETKSKLNHFTLPWEGREERAGRARVPSFGFPLLIG